MQPEGIIEAGSHTLGCPCHRAGLPHLSTPLPPCARCGMTTTTLQNHPLQGGGVTRPANQSPRSWVSNLWGGRGHAGGGHRVVREGPRPWEECTCPERRGTRGRPAAEAPAGCPSPVTQCSLGLGKAGDRPQRKTCPCVQFPARGKDTNNNNSTSHRSGREESLWPAPEWRTPKGEMLSMQDRRRTL